MASETTIYLPDTLPFPIKILSLTARASESVSTGRRLLNYSFTHSTSSPSGPKQETRIGNWDATFDGELKEWNLKVGDIVNSQVAKRKHALVIVEPCSHGVQVNGLCALCGMDMENFDYTGRPESSRATIQMTHSASGPVVSFEEAQRIERETAEHLLGARKLSLIVDLDQTIVHATVDPTVGDWISEGEAWEERKARREQRARKSKGDDEDDDSGDSDDTDSDDEEDEVNPNWEALKDVKKFRLAPDTFGAPPRSRWTARDKGKGKSIQDEGCLYYVKPRPGWEEFLSSISKKYEMHVYTMGTRAYAEEVCAAIDPDGSIFGGRILSRDESGSLTQKSLRRLFPCDTSMVVIIDDRADVWEWCPNLLKVIPFEFFVGIGDINSAFLPKVVDPLQAAQDDVAKTAAPSPSSTDASSTVVPSEESNVDDNSDVKSSAKEEMITQNTIALEAQVEDRPLAKQQELLEEEDGSSDAAVESTEAPTQNGASDATPDESHKAKHHHKKALLKNDDTELERIGKLLEDVHRRFYAEYDNRSEKSPKASSSQKGTAPQEQQPYDVKTIIPAIRAATFAGVHLLFSGVIPTNMKVPHEDTEVWRMAEAFGATCHRDLSKDITHVVTSKAGTQKVEAARARGGIFVVWLAWFSDSIAHWKKMDEKLYLLDDNRAASPSAPTASSPPSDPHAVSTDTDPEDLIGDDDEPDFELAGNPGEDVNMDMASDVPLALDDVDWQDVNDEVELAMMESDDEDEENGDEAGGSERRKSGSRASSVMSEDDGPLVDDNAPPPNIDTSIPRRKRLRSLTPSEYGNLPLQSPLAKRKKLAADRSGLSKLKETISAEDLDENADKSERGSKSSTPSPVVQDDGTEDEEDDGNEGGDEIEDDFLLNALEEELG